MVTYDALMRFAKTLEGKLLETSVQGKKFTVQVAEDKLIYTIENGNERETYKSNIEKVLDQFNQTKSYMPGHYAKVTANASYLLRLLEMMTSEATRKFDK